MTRQTVIQVACDICQAPMSESDPQVVVGIGPSATRLRTRMLDLCPVHAAELTGLVQQFLDAGHVIRPTPLGGKQTCAVCSQTLSTRSALASHIWSQHRAGERRPTPPSGKCPDCAKFDAGPAALARHRALVHGWDVVAEAMQGVAV